jgi:energy-coupling factor transporter ATP-binding protein EcfA2
MRTLPARCPPSAPSPAAPAPAAGPSPAPVSAAAREWAGRELLASPQTAQVFNAAWSGDSAVLVPSPPGAGKTRLITLLAGALADRAEMRVGIAAQTVEQAVEIARRAGRLGCRAILMWSGKKQPPVSGGTPAVSGAKIKFPSDKGGIIIGTTARWIYCEPAALGCDVMLVDEAWQVTYADLGALGAFAGQVVCVGDPGQIAPVVTGATTRWAGSPHGPHVAAPDALRAAYGEAVTVIPLPHTWRLGPESTALVQPVFYPALPFGSKRPPEHVTGQRGPLPEIGHRTLTATGGPADPALTGACADRVRDLLTGHHLTTTAGTRPLAAADIAVVTAHVNQAGAVRALLADEPDILVGTANQLQGLERPAVVVLHPLAGYREAGSAFGADMGRACVMLSRHRAHLTVIIDDCAAVPVDGPAEAAHAELLARLLASPAM